MPPLLSKETTTMKTKAKILIVLFVLIASMSSEAWADIKSFTKTVRQPITDDQSFDQAKAVAIERMKRESLEETGTYLEAVTVVKNSEKGEFTKDEILSLTAGVTKVNVISQKRYNDNGTFGIEISSRIDVDTSVLNERIKKMLDERGFQRKYEEKLKETEELKATIENEKINKRMLLTEKSLERDIVQARTNIDDYTDNRQYAGDEVYKPLPRHTLHKVHKR